MPYNLPFKPGDKIAEFGGAGNPQFHPNYDIRKLPGVDFVIDLNNLSDKDIGNNVFDGVFSRYLLEHISFRKVRSFLEQIFRITKTRGIVVFVTANLLEQSKVLVNRKEWDDKMVSMIFGDQNFEGLDWDQNSHHCGFSPEYIERIMKCIGFVNIKIIPIQTDVGPTDMIIEAIKMDKIDKETESINMDVYNRGYFDGDSGVGYRGEGYRNFASNYTVAGEILKILKDSIGVDIDRDMGVGMVMGIDEKLPANIGTKWEFIKPEIKVLELGGARGYISHILEGQGINTTCLDVSPHCFYTRACKRFILGDATDTEVWKSSQFEDKKFDLVFSKDFLEHIPEDKIDDLIKQMVRVSKKGFHLITFDSHPCGKDDKTHKCSKSKEWWIERFKKIGSGSDVAGSDVTGSGVAGNDYECIIEDKEKYERADLDEIKRLCQSCHNSNINGLLKLNIGSFIVMAYGWINIDKIDLHGFANQNGYKFRQIDVVRDGLKEYSDETVDLIVASHFLEHLTRKEGVGFLKECFRVLGNGGILRLGVPDIIKICKAYIGYNEPDIMDYGCFNIGVENAKDRAEAFWEMVVSGHNTVFDFQSLKGILEDAGFLEENIKRMKFGESRSKEIELQTIDMYPEISIFIEAEKRLQSPELIYTINDTLIRTVDRTIDRTEVGGTGLNITYGNTVGTKEKLEEIKERLKIGLISTPFFTVPPGLYGGLEMVVWDLACGLDELGHEVTIFGPQGSKTTPHGHLVEMCESNNTVNVDWFKLEKQNYEVYKDLIDDKKFDVIHDNTWFAFPYLLKQKYPQLKILHLHHGGWSWDSIPPFGKPNLVAISQFMQNYTIQYFKQKGYNVGCEYIYNGINLDKYPFQANKTDHLLFVGRLSSFKQPTVAIEVAKKAGYKLDIVGGTFVDSIDYVKQLDKMVENDPSINIYKDVTHEFKIDKMQNACALIFPSKMGEPGGLVALEAMSCGTPVIATRDGAIPEIVIHGKTGFICDSIEDMVNAIDKIDTIKPGDCRKRAEELSILNMAKGYEKLYYRILKCDEW